MATSSRQSAIFGVQDWKAIYQTFRQADFRSYDYETLRKSFIDYLRTYYPETYNDYIESSEFIALLDVIAYMGQGLAFRNDLNARENFIDTAERRDSVIKLANLVSYTPKRNLAGQGYIKITSIQTTQNVDDLNGFNLSNTPIFWNDPANPNWLEQFNSIINATLINTQRIGSPGNTSTILGVKTSEYAMNIPTNALPVVPFVSTVDGTTMNFELTSMSTVGSESIYELPPAPTGQFNILYRNDQLGYGSPNTGFFCYFKQGTLQNYDFTLQEQVSNQVVNIDIQGINNTDTWLYQLNNNNSSTPTTLWKLVENVYANAYLQTESSAKKIFSVTSRFNDQVSYVFGDGVFSEIPIGTFRSYVRYGNALTYTIDPTEMQGLNVSFSYISRTGRQETLTLGLSLQTPVSNAQARESLQSIKQRAPTRYYSQNRMVNGEDYNNFPYTLYSSIIKSKAINRSSVGVSKNLDLLDPTGKYSSTDAYANDGAMYLNTTSGYDILTIANSVDIISYLSNKLSATLDNIRATQYYLQNYPRYSINSTSGDGTVYWNLSTVDSNSDTGYFYNTRGSVETPLPTGTYNTHNLKYVTKGAMLKFIPPAGFYFNSDNRLVPGVAGPSDVTYIWTTVLNVTGDGYNNGLGQFSNGSGPVTLNGFVPNGAILTQVIPSFDNKLFPAVTQEVRTRMELNQSFSLVFNNSLTIDQSRWSVDTYNISNWFVNFECVATNRYLITYRSLSYFFGSVADTRFTFNGNRLVYDPFSGKNLQDYVKVLATNTQFNSNYPLAKPVQVFVVGQTIENDGYVDDYAIEISSIDVNNKTVVADPDFFQSVTGYQPNGSNIGVYTFFQLVQDAINLTRYQIVPYGTINSVYANKTQIEVVKYDYPEGQLFYAYDEGTFYSTVQDATVNTPYYIVFEPMVGNTPEYYVQSGRQGLQFQYRHNSDNTTRIDPVTTNIIDLYVVTQAYYTAYQNYIQDITNTIPEPNRPSISELSAEYDKVQDYKMLSDAVILNSVIFKPLFGPKAPEKLRATIKVIKNANTNASDSEIRSAVLTAMNSYFDINNWNFGDTFYFSELSAYLHNQIGDLISSAVLVPNDPTMKFGDLYEIKSMPYEIFVNAATANDVLVIAALTPAELQIA
jgi:hypothetical protein